jgi:hypothetical protein
MEKYHGNTVEYWKQNAEENYLTTPISVLKYITVLEEQAEQLRKDAVIKSVCDCMAFHKSDECYKLGCKAHRSDEVQTDL